MAMVGLVFKPALIRDVRAGGSCGRTANDNPELVERYAALAQAETVPQPDTPRPRARRVKKDDGQGALFWALLAREPFLRECI